jgi:hypothetical protein
MMRFGFTFLVSLGREPDLIPVEIISELYKEELSSDCQ